MLFKSVESDVMIIKCHREVRDMEEMEMVLPSKYVDLDEQEITYGGMSWYKGVLIGVTVV